MNDKKSNQQSMQPIHLCIGAPLSGSKWLYRELQQQPALFVPSVEDVRFWNSRRSDKERDKLFQSMAKNIKNVHDRADQERWLKDWVTINQNDRLTIQSYLDLMSVGGRPSLDISPTYSFLPPDLIRALQKGLPKGSKVLYFIRDPLERLSAQIELHFHLHGTYRGNPSSADLSKFLDIPNQKRRWDYAAVINAWHAEFGDDFEIIQYDEITKNPKALVKRIIDFLGIEVDLKTNKYTQDELKHSNPISHLWVTSPSISEKKKMAGAMLPAITAFTEKMPSIGKPWLSKLQKIADRQVSARNTVDDIDLPVQKLMRMTESIGDNCEYGMWQRHRAYEPSSLFRWAISPVASLLAFLDAPSALYAKDDLSVHSPGMVHDEKFGFKFHSKLVEPSADGKLQLLADKQAFDEIYLDEKAKIDHLQAKTFAQMKRQACLYIIKDNKGLDEGDVRRVLAHLLRHNPSHHLLWVEADGAPAFKDLGGGLLRGSLPSFAPYVDVQAYVEGGWTSLMTQLSQFEPIANQIARMQR